VVLVVVVVLNCSEIAELGKTVLESFLVIN